MLGPIIALVVFLGILVTMVVLVMKALKNSNPTTLDTSLDDAIDVTQDFLQFKDIQNGVIDLGGFKYRAIIECSSINYHLKTEREKEVIEITFQNFLTSMRFPFAFFLRTKVLNNTKMLEKLQDTLEETVSTYEKLQEYANMYYQNMSVLGEQIGNSKQKVKYMIIPYEEAISLDHLKEDEKYEFSLKELNTRTQIVMEELSSVGITSKKLNNEELYELIYSSYNKDELPIVEHLNDNDFLSLIIESDNKVEAMSIDARLDSILYEAQMKIRNELMINDESEFHNKNFNKCIATINKLRDETGAYFKEPTPEDFTETKIAS